MPESLTLGTGEQTNLGIRGSRPQYLATGHLLANLEGDLSVIAFDPDRLKTSGDRIKVLSDVYTSFQPQYAVSSDGSLVYAEGPWMDRTRFAWIDMNGNIEMLPLPANHHLTFQLSPEGNRVAVNVLGPEGHNIWIFYLDRGGSSRLTTAGNNQFPVWMPDGESIIFLSDQGGAWNVLRETVGAVPQVDSLWAEDLYPQWISPDGRYLLGNC